MNNNTEITIAVISSLSFVKLVLKDIEYEMHEIKIHKYLDMEGIEADGTVALARASKSSTYEIDYQPLEQNKRYIAPLIMDSRGFLYTMYDDGSKILEATDENIEKFQKISSEYDALFLGIDE